jgi:hypothetical protein
MTATVSHQDTGTHLLSGLGLHTHVHGEQFTGNAVLTTFTLAHTPLSGVDAFVAGVRLDVTLVGAAVTFAIAPALAALIRISYEY